MISALLLAAAEIAAVQFAGDCAATEKTVSVSDGEATTVAFADFGLRDLAAGAACRIQLAVNAPEGFRVGINGVRARGRVELGAGAEAELTLRGGAPGAASHASQLKSFDASGAFDTALGGGTLWFGCGETTPGYLVTLDLSGFQPEGAATSAFVRLDGVTIGAVVYKRCPRPHDD